jgi:hypothetical protein
LAQKVLDQLLNQWAVLLLGPARWGKTAFLADILHNHPIIRQHFARCIFLDLYTLRMNDPQTLEWEAVRWLHQGNERAFMHFMEKLDNRQHGNPLRAYLRKAVQNGPLLLMIAHMQYLSQNNQIAAWLKTFRNFLIEEQIIVLWSETAPSLQGSRLARLLSPTSAQALPPVIQMPAMEMDELAEWLSNPLFGKFADQPSAVAQVYRATGGLAALTRDFGRYLLDYGRKRSVEYFIKPSTQNRLNVHGDLL